MCLICVYVRVCVKWVCACVCSSYRAEQEGQAASLDYHQGQLCDGEGVVERLD